MEINGKWLLMKRCCGAGGMKGSEQISTPLPPFSEPTAALARPPFPSSAPGWGGCAPSPPCGHCSEGQQGQALPERAATPQ